MSAPLHAYDEKGHRSAPGVQHRLWLLVTWPFRGAKRLVGVGWLVACFIIGSAQLALADGDGFINTPEYGVGHHGFRANPADLLHGAVRAVGLSRPGFRTSLRGCGSSSAV